MRLLLLLTCLAFGACGSDDDSTVIPVVPGEEEVEPVPQPPTAEPGGQWVAVDEAPVWQVDWSYNQERPDWVEPEPSGYENWTVITVEIENELKATTSGDDLVAVFIDGDLCGLASPAVTVGGEEEDEDTYLYLLKVYSNNSSDTYQTVTLQYYSARLHQVFTTYAEISFSRYDDITELVPSFVSGSQKYPVSAAFQLQLSTTEASDFQPAEGDLLAAFVGDECRGVGTITFDLFAEPVWLEVYGQESDETITLKYYHAATNRVFTFNRTLTMSDSWQPVSLSF